MIIDDALGLQGLLLLFVRRRLKFKYIQYMYSSICIYVVVIADAKIVIAL